MLPTSVPRTQTPRAMRSTCRSLDPNGDTSSNGSSQLQPGDRYSVVTYSGRLSRNALISRPSALYSSTADVRRYVARSVRDHTANARVGSAAGAAGSGRTSSSSDRIVSI